MKKDFTDKKILTLSSAVETSKSTKRFTPIKFAFVTAIFLFVLAGIYGFINLGTIFSPDKMRSNMCTSPTLSIVEYENKLFFQNFKDGRKLYSIDLDGNNVMKLSKESVASFVIYKDQIYYTNGFYSEDSNRKIIISEIDGSILKVIESTNVSKISFVFDDWIYFSNEEGIYRIRINGSDQEKISDFVPYTLLSYGEKLYFTSNYEGSEGFYRAELNGKNPTRILDSAIIHRFLVYDNNVYYFDMNDNNNLNKLDLDTNISQKIIFNNKPVSSGVSAFDISNNKIYFHNETLEDAGYLYELELEGTNLNKLANIEATEIRVFGSNVYLYHPSYGGNLYKFNLEERNIEKILK